MNINPIDLLPIMALKASTPPGAARTSGMGRLLPWVIGVIVLLSLGRFLGRPPTPPSPPPPPSLPAPATAPAAVSFPVPVYFGTAGHDLDAEASARIGTAAEVIRKGDLKVEITGYADRRGDQAANEKLAKDRALAVKNALVTAGVPETSVTLVRPIFVEAGAPGADADTRRVDIRKP